ncbi:MAG TPA: AAA family ATPase [Acidimicrobiales bacterium]
MPKAQLVELYAHGLGVIEDARLELGPGFNVITGETGAGKTLLLGALELCLGGENATSRYAAHADMRTAAVFLQDADEIVLTREASTTGRLRSTLNGAPSSAEVLRTIAHDLVVIHGQHDSLRLRNRSEVLRIIDASGQISTNELDEVRISLREALSLRESFGGDEAARERELDFLEFQIGEIVATKIASKDELVETLESLTRLSSLRDGQEALALVIDELDADRDDAILSRLARCIERLPAGEAYVGGRDALLGALALAREGLHELAALSDPDAFDPAVMDQLDERAALLQQIARKYGGSLEAALETLEELRGRLDEQRAATVRLANLDVEINELLGRERELARVARREREYAAVQLTDAVRRQLPRVALANALLRFDVDGDDGSETQILFTPNPGLPEGPLQALASGGELSRVLLALSLETAHEDVVAVFDEIDTGVGGQVAQQIGQCLHEVGQQQQVLAVTHLASVAARADHHFVIEKTTSHGVTATALRAVRGIERVNEIARMLAGNEITDEAKALAQRLLETSG